MSGSGISWAICKSAPRSRQITTPAPHRSVFYRPDALPATQPTASKHWRPENLVEMSNYIFNISVQRPVTRQSEISDSASGGPAKLLATVSMSSHVAPHWVTVSRLTDTQTAIHTHRHTDCNTLHHYREISNNKYQPLLIDLTQNGAVDRAWQSLW